MPKSIKNPSQVRAINTKKVIIEVAKKCFFKYGYKKTNTILIAKEANVSVGIVYSYFKDKKDLLEIWLNNLLERCDDYFYNQLKLLEYEIEIPLIINNILEKINDNFFSSPIIREEGVYIKKILSSFYDKAKKIFVKSCLEADVFFKYPEETSDVILNLIIAYNNDLIKPLSPTNIANLKSRYITAICALLTSKN